MLLLGIDAGNSEVKVCSKEGVDKFPSTIGEYRERNLISEGANDMEWEYQGERGFAGTLADRESYYKRRTLGETKAHDDAKLRILLACYRNCHDGDQLAIVVGQPIAQHNPGEKEKIIKMLTGKHVLTVNGITKVFTIATVTVAAESAAAYFAAPARGTVHVVDAGAGTIGLATIDNGSFIDRLSHSMPVGVDSTDGDNTKAILELILASTTDWGRNNPVYVVGGIAESLLSGVSARYPKAQVIYPEHAGQRLAPVYANAVGFYNLAVSVYGE